LNESVCLTSGKRGSTGEKKKKKSDGTLGGKPI